MGFFLLMGVFLKKICFSLLYSWQGLCHVYKTEFSFRLEVYYFLSSTVALYFIPFPKIEKEIIFIITFLVLPLEIINSSLERIVNYLSPEKSVFAKQVKDMGSAIVFLVLILSFIAWGWCFYHYFN